MIQVWNYLNYAHTIDIKTFFYVKTTSKHPSIQHHFGCPLCVLHYEHLPDLKTHFFTNHREVNPTEPQQQATTPTPIEQEDLTPSTQQQSNPQSPPATPIEQKDLIPSTQQQSNPQSPPASQQLGSTQQKEQAANKRQASDDIKQGNERLGASGLNFTPIDNSERLIVEGFDVSEAFYKFQLSIGHQQVWKLSMEDHFYSSLASTSILFLSPKQYSDELAPFFAEHNYNAICDTIKKIYNINTPAISMNLITTVLPIIDYFLASNITRLDAIVKISSLDLLTHHHQYQQKFIKSLLGMILKLPMKSIGENVNESELEFRYLTGLFDDPDNGVYLRWTNEASMETRMNEGLWNKRPDLCITKLEGTRWKSSYGYSEIKSSTLGGINYYACYDLFKVAIFCKDALDTQNMKGMLGIQAIGRTLRFFLVTLPSSGLYIMYELAKIKIPDCLEDLSKLLMDLPSIILIHDVFNRFWIRSTDSPQPSRHLPTITISTFNSIFSSSKNNKRPCTLKMNHN